jgi:hypothetical protein
MQRDFDLVVTLLGALRDADTPSLSQQSIETAVQASMPESAPSAMLITHHLNILLDAGLIAAITPTASNSAEQMWRLTWKGHDALEQEEEDDEDEGLD